jgi:hypothetical protein
MAISNNQQSLLQSSFIVNEKEEECEDNFITYICENTDGILDSIDQMTFALNETAVTYGPVIVLKDAP